MFQNELIILAKGKIKDVAVALQTIIELFGEDMTLDELDYKIREIRLENIIKKQFKGE